MDRILVRGVNWIGDAVMTIPALRALRRYHRDSELSLLVKDWVAPVFYENPYIDRILRYMDSHRGIIGKLRLAKELRRENFMIAYLLQNAFDAAFITYLAGIPERAGYNRDLRGFFLTRPVPYNREDRKMHHVDYYLELLKRLGIDAPYTRPWIRITLPRRLDARSSLSSLRRPVLGLNPGATYGSAKRWIPKRFTMVIREFMDETGGSVVIFGSTNESPISEKIISGFEDYRILNLTGRTSLDSLIPLIGECDLLLSNDSGPMHIGYAVGTPVVALFGSTDPALTGPLGYRDIVLKKDIHCSPCFKKSCESMLCMDEITVDDVMDAIRRLIPRRKAVFFDRDGTLNRDPGYLRDYSEFELYPGVERLRYLKEAGYMLIGVTNQSGISRGIVDEGFVKEINNIYIEKYGFDDFYYCPHHPDEMCECRKPEPGMLYRARAIYNIDLRNSFVVGDRESDLILARMVGARAILLRRGKLTEHDDADYVVNNLDDVVRLILYGS